jgi:hypothetical protein
VGGGEGGGDGRWERRGEKSGEDAHRVKSELPRLRFRKVIL